MSSEQEIESIRQLKYRYFRFLDQKRLDSLEGLLLPECTAAYHGGRYSAQDRATLMAFLRAGIGKPHLLTLHQGHHPEIELIGASEARGIWYLHDIVIDLQESTRLEGNGFYEDRYRKTKDGWKILHTGYHRTFELKQPLGEVLALFNGFAEQGFGGFK